MTGAMAMHGTSVGAYEAKTHLSGLLDKVARGERITITKHGSLSREKELSVYDGAYLELALRLQVPPATKDVRLAKAAGRLGLTVLG